MRATKDGRVIMTVQQVSAIAEVFRHAITTVDTLEAQKNIDHPEYAEVQLFRALHTCLTMDVTVEKLEKLVSLTRTAAEGTGDVHDATSK